MRQPRDPDAMFRPAKKREVPFEFVLDALARVGPNTRPMFGSTGVYVGEKFVLILRDKGKDDDDGVWLGTDLPHHASLRALLPSLRSIKVFGRGVSKWQVLPKDADDFEESVLLVCKLVRAGDPRIGTVSKAKKKGTKKV